MLSESEPLSDEDEEADASVLASSEAASASFVGVFGSLTKSHRQKKAPDG